MWAVARFLQCLPHASPQALSAHPCCTSCMRQEQRHCVHAEEQSTLHRNRLPQRRTTRGGDNTRLARGHLARAYACRRAEAAVRLQSKWRGWALALTYRRFLCAAVVLTLVGCGALVRLACRRELAATGLQTHWRRRR